MIKVNVPPIQQPPLLPNGQFHPVWVEFFNQIARVAQGKDASAVQATNADTVDNYQAIELLNPTARQDVTVSRAMDTVYRNTTGKPMFVNVTASNGTSNALSAWVDSFDPPTTRVARINNAGVISVITFVVLPNEYYYASIGTGTPTLTNWIEWY